MGRGTASRGYSICHVGCRNHSSRSHELYAGDVVYFPAMENEHPFFLFMQRLHAAPCAKLTRQWEPVSLQKLQGSG